MKARLQTLDRLLRGGFTDPAQLTSSGPRVTIRTLLGFCMALGALYGVMMGLFSLLAWEDTGTALLQMLSTMVKVPLLFLLTLAITFPSLYVLSALSRTSLGAEQTAQLLLVAVTVDLALLASLGPILAFFTLSTESYPFMKLLNVLLFTVAGIGGLTFLQRTLAKWFQPSPAEAEGLDSGELSDAADSLAWRRRKGQEPSRTRRLFFGWCVLFGVVGAQMGWVLRPFLGDPGQPFALFRERESNILAQVLTSLGRLFQ